MRQAIGKQEGTDMGGRVTERSEATLPLTTALTLAARAVADRVEVIVADSGLSFDQWLVLDTLARTDGQSMAELASETHVTGPTLTRVVDRLVSNAKLYRDVDPADRRRVLVHLAPRGRSVYELLRSRVEAAERELLGDSDAGEVMMLLHRIVAHPEPGGWAP